MLLNKLSNTKSFAVVLLSLALSASAFATPSTQIWIPSTDIQATGTTHLGFDNYSTVNTDNGVQQGLAPSLGVTNYYDFGVTYGALPGLEVGVDYLSFLQNPLVLNVKYGIPEGTLPVAVAVGAYNLGTSATTTAPAYIGNDMNIVYGLVAKNFDFGRLSAGYYTANAKNGAFNTTVAVNGKLMENSGVLLSYDKQFTDKIWGAIDYQGGYNYFGAVSFGVSYAVAPNTSVIFGYDIYTLPPTAGGAIVTGGNTFTTQVDINI